MSIFDRFKKKSIPSRLWEAVIWGKGWTDYNRWDKRKLIEQGYERNAPFYAAANIIAQTVADIPVYVDAHKNGKVIQTTEHPILALMERDMSRTEFIERLTLYLVVTGETYAQIVFAERPKRPLGLICVPAQNMNPIMGDYRNPIAGFEYEDKKMIKFAKDEIIFISRPSLRDYFQGFSAGVPLSELIDLNNAAITWNKNVALAGGIPMIVAKGPALTKEEANRARDAWEQQSGSNNSHRLKFISDNVTLEKLNDKPHDAEWSKAVEQSMRMIFMAFGVSSELMNDAGNKTYCLPYDASVATPTGRKRIGEIKAGDTVYSLVDDSIVEKKVLWQGKTGTLKTKIITGVGFSLEATDNHPVFVLGEGYKRMDELKKGDVVTVIYRDIIGYEPITGIEEGKEQDVYDIEVEDSHNFFAQNVLVHNSNYREARKALYMEASIPMARKIYGAITKAVSKYYEDKPIIRLDVDKIESIQEDRGYAVERLTKAVLAGIITPNEAREELNYAPKNGGDELRSEPMKTGPLESGDK